MANYNFYKFKCRNCFKVFGIDQKCHNFTTAHREAIEGITGIKVPFITGDEQSSKICDNCLKVISQYNIVRQRMVSLQNGFIGHLLQSSRRSQDPTEFAATFMQQLRAVPRPSNLQRLMNQNQIIPKEQANVSYCTLCNKIFTYKFTAAAHIKMVHLKIKDFQCDLCPYRCGIKCNLMRHMIRNHIPDFSKKLACQDCGMFIYKKYLMTHRLKFHRSKAIVDFRHKFKFICCAKMFISKPAVTRHGNKHHKGLQKFKKIGGNAKKADPMKKK